MRKLLIVALIALPGYLFAQGDIKKAKIQPNVKIIDNSKGNGLAFIGFKDIQTHPTDKAPKPIQINKTSKCQKEELKPSTLYHLTINYSQTMQTEGSWVFITSNSHFFTRADMDFSADGLIGEIDVPANTYEILSMYDMYSDSYNVTPKYIITNSFTIESDTTLEINFEAMANHTIYLPMINENGEEIDRSDTNMLHNTMTIDIELPAGNTITASINQISIPNGCIKVSDVVAGYKIILNQLMIMDGVMYIADMGMVENLSNDTTLQNDYNDYKKMNMVFHNTSQNTGANHLNFGYGTNYYDDGQYYFVQGYSFGNDGSYSSHDNDTLQVFMNNRQLEITDSDILTCIATVSFVDEANMSIRSSPFFVNSNDSIAFTTFNLSAVTPQFETNSIIDVGNSSPFYRIYFYNEPDNLYAYCVSMGDKLEERKVDNYFSVLEISNEDNIIFFDYVSNYMEPIDLDEPGPYSLNILNYNYEVNGQTGEYRIENSFDTSIDPTPPSMSSFKIVNSQGESTTLLKNDETGHVIFSAYDYQPNLIFTPYSAKIWFKKYEEEDWTEISIIELPYLFDYIDMGAVYKSDLTNVINQFEDPGFLDLKIVVEDISGNLSSHTWHPAAYIDNQVATKKYDPVTTPELVIYPNPTNEKINLYYKGNTSFRFQVINVEGKVIYLSSEIYQDSFSIDCNAINLTNGLYFIRLIGSSGVLTQKFLYKN